MKKDEFYLLVLILPLIVAGCTLPGLHPSKPSQSSSGFQARQLTTPTGGLEMTLSLSNPEPFVNSTFTVMANVKNVGSSDATDIKVKLAKVSGDFDIIPKDWQSLGTLPRPVEDRESSTQYAWTVTAGERSGELEATLKYKYTTEAKGDIIVYNINYVTSSNKILQEAQSSPGIKSFDGTAAPITISVNDNGPIYYRGESSNTIVFYLTNSGNGLVYDPDSGENIRHVRVTIKIGDTICKDNEDVQLNFVGSTPIKCEFDPATDTKKSVTFDVKVTYYYEETSKISVNVKKV